MEFDFCGCAYVFLLIEAAVRRCFVKKVLLEIFAKFTGKHLCQGLFLDKVAGLEVCNFSKKETLVQVFSCEFCEISKNIFYYRTPLVAASVLRIFKANFLFKTVLSTSVIQNLLTKV